MRKLLKERVEKKKKKKKKKAWIFFFKQTQWLMKEGELA